MTRLIEVTESLMKKTILINIDAILKVIPDEHVKDANAKISLSDTTEIFVIETLEQIKSMCNS